MTIGTGKRPRDPNQLAKWIVDRSTDEAPEVQRRLWKRKLTQYPFRRRAGMPATAVIVANRACESESAKTPVSAGNG
jgi:hypothetical protein